MSIASRTLHTIHPTPPATATTTTTYEDADIRFDSGGKGDPEPYLYNTFGPLDEVEETSHGNGAQNDNNICKGDIQDPSLKTKATADYCETNFNANSVSTIVETNEQQQQTINPPPTDHGDDEDEEQQQQKEVTANTTTPNDMSSSYDAKESAQHLWDEDGVVVPKEHVAEWLGGR